MVLIKWDDVTIKVRTTILLQNVSLELIRGESLGVIGENSTGKTVLAKALAGEIPVYGNVFRKGNINIAMVSFQSDYRLQNGHLAYRQQRWNNLDPELIPKVSELISYHGREEQFDPILEKFSFLEHINDPVINLSNGEQRKLELIKALADTPDILILDNAYNGLDSVSKEILSNFIQQLIDQGQTMLIAGLSIIDMPEKIEKIIRLDNTLTPEIVVRFQRVKPICNIKPVNIQLPQWKNTSLKEIFSLRNVSLKIGEKTILKNINWTIKAGEKWVLSGRNGAGKTSLMNMIFADNPKAYACDISLFGKQKGTGETIWDIKKEIGFISPELQQYYPRSMKAIDVVISGLFDSEGLYVRPTGFHKKLALEWLAAVDLQKWANEPFGNLSSSVQRMALFVRALIKNPPLLLLDEPFQGFDSRNVEKATKLLEQISKTSNCAMIFISHEQEDIPKFFDLEISLQNGEVSFLGNRFKK